MNKIHTNPAIIAAPIPSSKNMIPTKPMLAIKAPVNIV